MSVVGRRLDKGSRREDGARVQGAEEPDKRVVQAPVALRVPGRWREGAREDADRRGAVVRLKLFYFTVP